MTDEHDAPTSELALQALIEFGQKEPKRVGGRPSVIEVRDAQLRDALAEKLATLNTSVRQVETLPAVAEALPSSVTCFQESMPGQFAMIAGDI